MKDKREKKQKKWRMAETTQRTDEQNVANTKLHYVLIVTPKHCPIRTKCIYPVLCRANMQSSSNDKHSGDIIISNSMLAKYLFLTDLSQKLYVTVL